MAWYKPVNQLVSDVSWELISCPVCDSEQFSELFKKHDEPFVKCTSCGLVLINPRPVHDQLVNTYDNNYSQLYAEKAEKKFRRIRRWVKRVKRKYVSSGRWLDVGCSVGFVVKVAEEFGFDGFGVDIQSWGVKFGHDKLGLTKLSCGMLEDQNYPNNYFNVISLYDVIEHVPDLNKLVAELKRILSSEGVIDIITPDIGHWNVPSPLHEWNEIKPSQHMYYFNKTTLSQLLDRHGINIIEKRFSLKPSLKVFASHIKT